jgi:hypothetical protein
MPTAPGTKHWCERARKARAIASHMHDLQARHSMLEIAERYERKARRTEAKLARRDRDEHVGQGHVAEPRS